jgi:hypothetical protein
MPDRERFGTVMSVAAAGAEIEHIGVAAEGIDP